MELVLNETNFGKSVKCGKGLVCELYKTGKAIVFEQAYQKALETAAGGAGKVHTLVNSHSGKTNWVAKLDEKQTEALVKTLKGMEYIHTAGVSKAKPKKEQPKKAEPKKAQPKRQAPKGKRQAPKGR